MNNDCCIVIPAYKAALSESEEASLMQCCKVLEAYDIYIVCPSTMPTDRYVSVMAMVGGSAKFIPIAPYFFRDRKTYSRLCEDAMFYGMFDRYEYMLLYQLDAWVFSDRLQEFCDLGYDYIGAPHCAWMTGEPLVGNGGLSLRRISKFVEVCCNYALNGPGFRWEEDRAFTEGPCKNDISVPPVDIAYRFSIQSYYELGMMATKGANPFGSHQGDKFWPDWNERIKHE